MISSIPVLLSALALSYASPLLNPRTVDSLNQAAFDEAQQKDNTATRAFTGVPIKTSSGQCLFVNELSGDFRANLNPIQVGACDGSAGQQWDIITKGKHDDQAGTMLIVNDLTNACMNFDPRRAAGNTVIMFSCGGRADGGGQVTNSQLFTFSGGSGPLALAPINQAGTCLTVKGNVLDQAACNKADSNQAFTFGGSAPVANPAPTTSTEKASSTDKASSSDSADAAAALADPVINCPAAATVTVTREVAATAQAAATSTKAEASKAASSPAPAVSAAAVGVAADAIAAKDPAISSPTEPVPVSGAGGTLQPSSVAEAQVRDNTATRAFSNVQIRSGNGLCLFADPTAGDFRENLIPGQFAICNSNSPTQRFDLITKGVHNNAANSMLVVSADTQGCLSVDARRAAGQTVQFFSCGGRGDGSGQVTNSQLFTFNGSNTFTLQAENSPGICLGPNNAFGGKLDSTPCNGSPAQTYTVVQ